MKPDKIWYSDPILTWVINAILTLLAHNRIFYHNIPDDWQTKCKIIYLEMKIYLSLSWEMLLAAAKDREGVSVYVGCGQCLPSRRKVSAKHRHLTTPDSESSADRGSILLWIGATSSCSARAALASWTFAEEQHKRLISKIKFQIGWIVSNF